jgi:hypothetical protein
MFYVTKLSKLKLKGLLGQRLGSLHGQNLLLQQNLDQCYKSYYRRNLRIFVISLSLTPRYLPLSLYPPSPSFHP